MSFLSKMFGTQATATPASFTPPGFNAGGLNTTFNNNSYSVTPSDTRTSLVTGLSNAYSGLSSTFGNLLSKVAPGFSQLRTAQLGALNANRSSTLSTLRQNLSQRRVLGSSFGQDAVNRTNAQFNQDQAKIIGDTFLQELDATTKLTQDQFQAASGAFKTQLDEMNLEAGLASDMTSKVSSTLANVATSNAQLMAKNSQFNADQAMKWVTGIGQAAGTLLSFA